MTTITFNVVTDFNNTGTQPEAGDPFTYGTETSLNTGFTLFPNFQANGTVSVGSGQFTTNGTLANYYISQAISGPCVGEVATGGPLNFSNAFTIPNDVLAMMPGDPGLGTPEDTVVRFTAPENGVFNITGSFINLEWATVSVFVVVNGITEFTGGFGGGTGGTIPFSISDLHLEAGDTVDFIVDSLGSRNGDVLGLQAVITETVLPPVSPVMLDAVYNSTTKLTKLSGTAEADSSVSVFDGNKLVGTATAAADGTWSLQANVTGNVVHSYTETSTLGSDTASSAGVTLYTPAANKSLQGGSGNDVLIGRPNDTLTGGGGSDTFVFNPNFGKETITDFDVTKDVMVFVQALATNFSAHDDPQGNAVITFPGDNLDKITLDGVHSSALLASNFQFV
jgi:Ca2+-binding RTX toxin-like protein